MYLQCHNCLPVGRYVEIIKHLQRRYKKVGIIIDNASTIICIAMRKCLDYLDGDMETSHLPLHLQQLNPIKTEWGRIKAAIANTPFGDLDKMQYAIRQMIHN
ncbi:MAG: hypothetical protein F4Y18_00445 [Cenarchaeum sp. SB0663_bin_5]|nr:hypothetical protein [Cenarchaeum sp. SB0663_bin_5]